MLDYYISKMIFQKIIIADDGTRWCPKASKKRIKMSILNTAVSFVFLFLLKIRFPKETPISTIIERRYGRRTLSIFRKYERIRLKYQKCQCDLNFLMRCKSYNIVPKFLHFKLYKNTTSFLVLYNASGGFYKFTQNYYYCYYYYYLD